MSLLVFIVILLLFAGALPLYRYNRHWGYYPAAIVLAIAAVVAVSLLA